MSSKPHNRNINYDWMRVIAMLMVIMVHVPIKPLAGVAWFSRGLHTFLMTCNGLFFMLSGRLNLVKRFDTKSDMLRFYQKRLETIVLPFVIGTAILTLFKLINGGAPFSFLYYLKVFYRDLIGDNAVIHLWFIYELTGLLLATPFLARMLQGLDDSMLRLLFILSLGWNTVMVYLSSNLGLSFGYNNWLFMRWGVHYLAGYVCFRLVQQKHENKLFIIAILSFVLNVASMVLWPDKVTFSTDLAPLFILWCMGAFVFLERRVRWPAGKLSAIVSWLAKYSYLIYIFHFAALLDVVAVYIPPALHTPVTFLVYTFCALALSLAVSLVTHWVLIRPCQALLKKLPRWGARQADTKN